MSSRKVKCQSNTSWTLSYCYELQGDDDSDDLAMYCIWACYARKLILPEFYFHSMELAGRTPQYHLVTQPTACHCHNPIKYLPWVCSPVENDSFSIQLLTRRAIILASTNSPMRSNRLPGARSFINFSRPRPRIRSSLRYVLPSIPPYHMSTL